MSGIKKLAGETLWYGVSSIFARFLYYLLTPYLTYKLTGSGYGEMSLVYAAIPFLNTLFLYGMETAYFRFYQKAEYKNDIYSTVSLSIFGTTILFTFLLILFHRPFANLILVKDHPEYLVLIAFIIGFDAISQIPFAKLRLDGRPRKFALIRVGGILLNIGLIYFFLSVCPAVLKKNPNSPLLLIYSKDFGVGYILLANMAQALFQVFMVSKELRQIKWKFNTRLWKEVIIYAMPLMIAGFAGMINEVFDRIMLGWWAPVSSIEAAKMEVGTYSACYKLSILITLFIQAFRMGAEPFFFRQSVHEDAPKIYARVMKFFVITVSLMFLAVAMFIDEWKYFIQNEQMWEGLRVVPILLFANIFLGIYYNLSIWYKLSHTTSAGAYITIAGAVVTVVINYLFIPKFSYMACAWATFFCYGSMMVISYIWGQKKYRIPYAWKKLVAYLVIVAVIYFIHKLLGYAWKNDWFSIITASLLSLAYIAFIVTVEKKEFRRMPVIGRYLGGSVQNQVGS